MLMEIRDNSMEWHVMLPQKLCRDMKNFYVDPETAITEYVDELNMDLNKRRKFLKEIKFFQTYTFFACNDKLQEKLRHIHNELKI